LDALEDTMDDQERRAAATKRIKAKRRFRNNLVSYVVINAFLVGVWALSGGGYFWPAWGLLGGGVLLALFGWSAYRGMKPISDEESRREMGDSG
jgi:fatty acid desaturase